MASRARASTPPPTSKAYVQLNSKDYEELVACATSEGVSHAEIAKINDQAHVDGRKDAMIDLIIRCRMQPAAAPNLIHTWNNSLFFCSCQELAIGFCCPWFLDFEILVSALPLAILGFTFHSALIGVLFMWFAPGIIGSSLGYVYGPVGSLGGVLWLLVNYSMVHSVKEKYKITESPFTSILKMVCCPCPFKMQVAQHVREVLVGQPVKVE